MARQEGLEIRLHPGSEIMFTTHTVQALREGSALTLANRRHVLVEFMPDTPHDALLRGVMDLCDAGYQPVLAHAERYTCLRQRDRLPQLKQSTRALIQMNAPTVLRAQGLLGDGWSRRMLREGIIDLVASDAHNDNGRTCRMGEARKVLTRLTDEETALDLTVRNPSQILEDGQC